MIGSSYKFFVLQATIWELLGLRWPGLVQAVVIPLCLTMILFLGPLYMEGLSGVWKIYIGWYYF